nr:hypothetical protein [Tanacetum cinerariifolium]
METKEKEPKDANVKKELEHETQDTEPIPITVDWPTTKPILEAKTKIIRSSSRLQITDPIVEDPNAPVVNPYEINEVLHHLTNEQLQAHIDKEEKLEKAAREPRLSKPELIKVIHKVAKEDVVDPKALQDSRGGQEFIRKQDVKLKVLKREHLEKVAKEKELRKKRIDQYRWTTSSRVKLETNTDIHIHRNTKHIVITVYRGNDKGTLRFTTPSGLEILRELGINPTLHALGQVLSLISGRKRKTQEVEPKTRIPGIKRNRILLERV